MGWGTITGGGTDGLYTLALDYGSATRDQWLAGIDSWILQLNIQIAGREAAVLDAQAKTEAAQAALQELINDLASGPEDQSPRLMAEIGIATAKFAQAQAAEDAVRIPRDAMIQERNGLAKRKRDLESAVVTGTKQAWCVDLTEDATGYVATIEIPGEDQAVLIAPGGRQPVLTRDGILTAREVMSPEQVFLAAALLPGVQKFKPTYRKGTITYVDADANIANVLLDKANSSAASLDINQTPTLNGVPVRYMECDAAAFEVGSRVVVEFEGQSWQSPRVIGFVDHPQPCTWIVEPEYINGSEQNSALFCLRPGVFDSIYPGAEITCWVNGSGPYALDQLYYDNSVGPFGPPVSYELEGGFGIVFYRDLIGGTYNTYTSQNVFPMGVINGSGDPVWDTEVMRVSLSFYGPGSPVLGSRGEHGAIVITIGSGTGEYVPAIGFPPQIMDAPQRNIAEFVIQSGSETVLHFAATDFGYSLTPGFPDVDYGVSFVKGVPFRHVPGSPNRYSRLEYSFIGS